MRTRMEAIARRSLAYRDSNVSYNRIMLGWLRSLSTFTSDSTKSKWPLTSRLGMTLIASCKPSSRRVACLTYPNDPRPGCNLWCKRTHAYHNTHTGENLIFTEFFFELITLFSNIAIRLRSMSEGIQGTEEAHRCCKTWKRMKRNKGSH